MATSKISDLMIEPVKVTPDMDIYAAAHEILVNQVSGVTVVDENDQLVGVLSELDCLRAIVTAVYNGGDPGGALVGDMMTTNVDSNSPDEDVITVAKSMLETKHRRRPVLENGELKGQLTCRQILKAVTEMAETKETK